MKHGIKKRMRKWIAAAMLSCLVLQIAIPSSASSTNDTYTIYAEANEGGTISPEGNCVLAAGQSRTYTFTPEYGYVISDVIVDDESKGAMATYTFDNIQEAHDISVVFARRSGDLNKNGICDEEDIAEVRDTLLTSTSYDETIDTNRDNVLNIADYVRTLRQKTLWGNTFESMENWTYNAEVLGVSGGKATFSGSTSALSTENFGGNYSVSANVVLDSSANGNTCSAGVMARRMKTTYYDYRLFYYNGAFELRLQRYGSDGNVTLLATYSELYIQNVIGYQALAFGMPAKLRLVCQDAYVYCYLDDCFVGSYEDLDATAPKEGTAGFKTNNANGSISNFEVQSNTALTVVGVTADKMTDGKITLYEGGSVYQNMETVHGICVDGTILTTDVQHTNISEYDSTRVGEQSVTMSWFKEEISVPLVVQERRQEIVQISDQLESKATEEWMQKFRALSEYEQSLCSENAMANYEEAVKAQTMALSDTDDEVLVYDLYNDNQVSWDAGVEIQRGKAFTDDGRYCIEQTSHGMSVNCWRTVDNLYGEVHAVSADMMATSVYTATGLTLNVGTNGYYYARVLFGVADDGTCTEPTLRLYRKASNTCTLGNVVTLSNYGIYLNQGRWFHMSMTYNEGVLCVYIDGTKLIEVDDSAAVEKFSCGSAGVYSYAGDSKFDNFVVCGDTVEISESPMQPISTSYFNDFENETEGSASEEWMHQATKPAWSVIANADVSNQYYGVVATEYSDAKLHVHEKNPTISLDFMYEELTDASAKFGFEIRKSGETAYVRVGYDKASGMWCLTESICDAECDTFTYKAAETVDENKWHTAKIVADGSSVRFAVDGQNIFDLSEVSQTGFGRIAVYAEGTAFSIDNVSCKLPSGDEVQAGVLEYYLDDDDDYAASFEIESLSDGNLVGIGYNVVAISDDYGETFTKITDDEYAALDAGGSYSSMIQLHDGNYLFIKQNDFKVLRSEGNMTAWEEIGTVIPEDEITDSRGRKTAVIHMNSLTEVQLADGTWRVFLPVGRSVYDSETSKDVDSHYTSVYYSDDGGETWECSVNDTRDVTLLPQGKEAADWCEAKIIKCADGSLRMYCSRNEYGSMLYTTSENGGKTWKGMGTVPQLQCAKSSFSIIEDGSNSGVYYMVWVNDSPNYLGSSFGRSRLSLARSTDGKNWEFLCDVERNSPYVWSDDLSVTSPIFQIVDPSIEVTDDYVYVSYGTSDRTLPYDNGYHNAQQIKIVRLDKSKLRAREWNAYTLSDTKYTSSLAIIQQIDPSFVVGETFTYEGGIVELVALDGTKKKVDTERFYLLSVPDMTTAGEKEVILYNRNGFTVIYKITVKTSGYGEIF